MLKKATAAWKVLKAGERVADPGAWKQRQVNTTVITGFLWALIHAGSAFGVEVPVDDKAVDSIAIGILALVNVLLTFATTNKLGIDGVRAAE